MKAQRILSFSLLVFLISSCVDHNAENSAMRQQLVTKGVMIKIEEFRQREWDKCMEQARLEAVIHVDSLIRAMAKDEAIEPVAKPPKPERPEKPELKILPDSVKQKISPEKD